MAASAVGARDLRLVLGLFKQDRVLAHRRQQGVLQTSSAFTQTQSVSRDVCQGVPKQPSAACISLAGLTHTSSRKEYHKGVYKPAASEVGMPPGVLCRTGCLGNLRVW